MSTSCALAAPMRDQCTASISASPAVLPNVETSSCRSTISFGSQDDFSFFSSPRSVPQCLQDVLALQIGVISEDLINTMTNSDLSDNHAHCYPHAADTRFPTHYLRILG